MSDWKNSAPSTKSRLGSRVVASKHGDIAIFRLANDEASPSATSPAWVATLLSQGIVSDGTVTCPLHGWKIRLDRRGDRT